MNADCQYCCLFETKANLNHSHSLPIVISKQKLQIDPLIILKELFQFEKCLPIFQSSSLLVPVKYFDCAVIHFTSHPLALLQPVLFTGLALLSLC